MKQNNQKVKGVNVGMEKPQKEPVLTGAIRKAGLPIKDLKVFALYFYYGKSHGEIAKKLGVCRKRVIFVKKRAINRMKAAMPQFTYELFKARRRKMLAIKTSKKEETKNNHDKF